MDTVNLVKKHTYISSYQSTVLLCIRIYKSKNISTLYVTL